MSKKLRIGEMLLKAGILTRQQLEEALKAQLIYGGKLGTNLVEHGFVTEEFLTSFLSKQCNIPAVDSQELDNIAGHVIESVPREMAERHKVVPFKKENRRLDLALIDPTNLRAIDELSFKTGLRIRPYVAPEVTIIRCLERYYEIPRPRRYIRIESDKEAKRGHVVRDISKLMVPVHDESSVHQSGNRLESDSGDGMLIGVPDAFPNRPMPMLHVVNELQAAETNSQIIQLILQFGRAYFQHRSVLVLRAGSFEVVSSEGSLEYVEHTKKLTVPIESPNIIHSIFTNQQYHLGTIPANPENFAILEQFGEEPGSMLFLLPLIYNQRVELILFASRSTQSFALDHVRRFQMLMEKASLANQILLLKNRLRLLPEDLH